MAAVHGRSRRIGCDFGIYGALIGLLLVRNKSIPSATVASLAGNASLFVAYNLIYGLHGDSHIDIAAHLGGLLTGLLAGCALGYRMDPTVAGPRLQRSGAVALLGLVLMFPIARQLRAGDATQAESYWMEVQGKSKTIGKRDKIVYSGSVTGEDALRLGQHLQAMGFLQDRGALVLYSRDAGVASVSFILKDRASGDPKIALAFNIIGRMLTRATSTPLKLRVLNSQRELKREFVFN